MSQKTADIYLKHLSDLATISPVAVELISKVEDINVSREEIAQLVKKDDVLFSNVFKLVNSAALGLPRRVQNIVEAINVIGMFQLRSLTFMIAAKKVFVDLELWYKSVFLAYSAEKIASALGQNQNFQSDIYISGLMMSSGQLIFKMFYRDKCQDLDQVLDYQERLKGEEKIFGISSIDLSCAIVKSYGLPEPIYSILSKQGLDWQDEQFSISNAILKIAYVLAEIDSKNMDEFELRRALRPLIDSAMLEKFGMNDLHFDHDFVAELHEGTEAFVNAYSS